MMGNCIGKPEKKKEIKVRNKNVALKMTKVPEAWDVKRTMLRQGATVLQTDLLDLLEQGTVLSVEQRNKINTCCHSNFEQMEAVLDIVGDDTSCQERLYGALTESGQGYLVDYISKPLPLSGNEPSGILQKLKVFLGQHYSYVGRRLLPWFRSDGADLLNQEHCMCNRLYADGCEVPLEGYQDLFCIGIPPVRILIQGETGIGKSTFLNQIVSDWGEKVTKSELHLSINEEEEVEEWEIQGLTKYDLVLLLQLKPLLNTDIKGNLSSFDLICTLVDTQLGFFRDQDKAAIKSVISKNQNKVLVLIDDLEYCPGNYLEPLKKLIHGDELKDIFCVVTSRNTDALDDDNIHCLWKYGIKGKLNKDAVEYAKAFAQKSMVTESDTPVVSDMLKDIRLSDVGIVVESPDRWAQPPPELAPGLLRFSGLLYARCKMWENRQQLFPITWTQSCSTLVLQLLKRHQRGVRGLASDESLMKEYQQELTELGHIAFDIILTGVNQATFKQSWIQEKYELTKEAWDLGIMVQTSMEGEETLVMFHHSYLVEYLAAFYIIHETNDHTVESKEIELKACCPSLDAIFKNRIIFRLVCGLSHFSGNRLLQWCVSHFSDTLFPNQVEPLTHFLLECLAEYENKNLARFPLPPDVACSITEESLALHETLFGIKLRTGPEYGKVSSLSLNIHPSMKFTEKMVTNLIHPITSGPLKELVIVCGDTMARDAYQQLYNEVKFMKNLTSISIRLHRRHKDGHFFRSLLNKLSALEKLSVIDIRIEHPDIPAPLGQGGSASPYASFCV